MFVGFTKTLKKMTGFRLGFGLRVNKRNWWYWCIAMFFVGMFYLMWYMVIAAGYGLYFMCWAIYKIYYYMFKGIAIGCKKLYQLIKGKSAVPVPSVPEVSVAEEHENNIYDNEVAAAFVIDILKDNGVDTSLKYEYTAEYLKIVTDDIYKLCFCRLKFSGQSRYIELTISAKDRKLLADDPRFAGIDVAKKRFTRIPVSRVEDVKKYADVIYLAYVWGTTTA